MMLRKLGGVGMSSEVPRTLKIGDFAQVKGGKRMPAGTSLVSVKTKHPYLRIVDFKDGTIEQSNLQYVPEDVFPKISRYTINSDEIYISIVGTIGLVGSVPHELSGANLTENAAKICQIDESKVDSRYLGYFLRSDAGQDTIKSLTVGSTQPKLALFRIEQIEVPCPSLDVQQGISEILGSLDDRITLLRETNATLESIAQALFKSWFVDFDPVRAKMEGRAPEGMDEATAALFPDSFEETELGAVPRGWRVAKLGDVLALRNERTKPSEETEALPYVPIESITAKVPFLQEYKSGDAANSSLILFRKGDILFGAMRPYFHKVCIAPFDGVTRTTVFTLKPANPKASSFALFTAFQESAVDYATKHSEGSTIPYAKWKKSLENMPIVFPQESLQVAFSEIVSSFVDRANENIEGTQTLAALRDTLLPRLISGQLRLPEAQAELEAVDAV